MKEFEVLSVRDIDFINDQNQTVSGAQLWVCSPTVEPGWNGWEVSKVWIPRGHGLYPNVKVLGHGDIVDIVFNHKGKPEQISRVG